MNHECFTAVAGAPQPAQAVFDRKGRSGNGETWLTVLNVALEKGAKVGPAIDAHQMGFGMQHEVSYLGRSSWVGYDVEAGGAVFCSPDPELLSFLRTTYEQARRDPQKLASLIDAVPDGSWDD